MNRTVRRIVATIAVSATAMTIGSFAGPAWASTPGVTEYGPLPTPLASPCEVEFDQQGMLWIEEETASSIARFDEATNTFTEFRLPTPFGYPGGMDPGPDGAIWFTEFVGNAIGRIDTHTGAITEYRIPWANALSTAVPYGVALADDIVTGADGGLWFTLDGINAIGRIDPATGVMTKYQLPTAGALPLVIQKGPGRTIVFGETVGNKIGMIDVDTKQITEFPVPSAASFPQGVTTGADGKVWFTETLGQRIGTLDTTTGAVTEIPVPPVSGGALLGSGLAPLPGPIRMGTDGDLYFTEGNLALSAYSALGRYDPSTKTFSSIVLPSVPAGPCDVNNDHPGEIWFGENAANKVGVYRY